MFRAVPFRSIGILRTRIFPAARRPLIFRVMPGRGGFAPFCAREPTLGRTSLGPSRSSLGVAAATACNSPSWVPGMDQCTSSPRRLTSMFIIGVRASSSLLIHTPADLPKTNCLALAGVCTIDGREGSSYSSTPSEFRRAPHASPSAISCWPRSSFAFDGLALLAIFTRGHVIDRDRPARAP